MTNTQALEALKSLIQHAEEVDDCTPYAGVSYKSTQFETAIEEAKKALETLKGR